MRGSPRYERIIRCQNRQSNFTSASAAASLALQDCGSDRARNLLWRLLLLVLRTDASVAFRHLISALIPIVISATGGRCSTSARV
jgi:hypothetical protein